VSDLVGETPTGRQSGLPFGVADPGTGFDTNHCDGGVARNGV